MAPGAKHPLTKKNFLWRPPNTTFTDSTFHRIQKFLKRARANVWSGTKTGNAPGAPCRAEAKTFGAW